MGEHREPRVPSPSAERVEVVDLELPHGFETVMGGRLASIQVAYEAWGELDPSRSNVVLIAHPLTTDTHVTAEGDDDAMGWWEKLVGPGRAVDTERYFVVCPNLLGSCFGTTGPRSAAPDGAPYLERFPLLTPRDLQRCQRLFLDALGIERVAMVLGASLGGMVAWEWAVTGEHDVDRVVVVAAPLSTKPFEIGLNWLQRRGIEMDLLHVPSAARAGLMIARGVGMLSYRSPVGLDEKFGRDWFRKPGTTLGERGMFNVESWLRQHGKRIVRRFDPFAYICLSRAMDLHDVGEGRGGLTCALDRVRCEVLVVGISSDCLYQAADVRLGADILRHLGRPVEYAEIRSPHGHDAFLLEWEQLGDILQGKAGDASAPARVSVEPAVETVRLALLGAGRVAALLVDLLGRREASLAREHGLRFQVTAVGEIDANKSLPAIFSSLEVAYDLEAFVRREDADVFVDLTRGRDSDRLVEAALLRGRPVVTPNKSLVYAHGARLEAVALEHGVRLAYHNSIAAGWPLLYSLERPLERDRILGIQAVLSSTCNVILEQMERGASLDEALAAARWHHLPEPDPELDLGGWDTAQKMVILLARALGLRFRVDDLPTRHLSTLDPVLVRQAPAFGLRVKLVGLYRQSATGPVLACLPLAVAQESHLGSVGRNRNVVVIQAAEAGEMAYTASGTGDIPVASAVLADLIGLFRPELSWTGRYPWATEAVQAPTFRRSLVRDGGRAEIVDGVADEGIPLL